VFNRGIIPRTSEPIRRVFTESTHAGISIIPKPTEINAVTTNPKIADPFANTIPQTASPTRAQGRTFTPLYMSLTSKPLILNLCLTHFLLYITPPNTVYHQQRGHGTDRYYRLRHEVQNLIDNQTIAPPYDPNDRVPHPHLTSSIHCNPPTTPTYTSPQPIYLSLRFLFQKARTCA